MKRTRSMALITAAPARGLDEDMAPLLAALRARGVPVEEVDWDTKESWGHFAAGVLRSTWDYQSRLPEFFEWMQRVTQQMPLYNEPALVRWNLDKHYLGQLQSVGVPVVPSVFLEPEVSEAPLEALVERALERVQALARGIGEVAEIVTKPSVGAGSRDVQRHRLEDRAAIREHAGRLLAMGRSLIVQPYLARVDEEGETALIYFHGTFSHAIRKGPLLRRGEPSTRALFAPEHIEPRVPRPAELECATAALAAVQRIAPHRVGTPASPPPYARVDLLGADGGRPRLLELEMAEPSLFLNYADGAAERCAAAFEQLLG